MYTIILRCDRTIIELIVANREAILELTSIFQRDKQVTQFKITYQGDCITQDQLGFGNDLNKWVTKFTYAQTIPR